MFTADCWRVTGELQASYRRFTGKSNGARRVAYGVYANCDAFEAKIICCPRCDACANRHRLKRNTPCKSLNICWHC